MNRIVCIQYSLQPTAMPVVAVSHVDWLSMKYLFCIRAFVDVSSDFELQMGRQVNAMSCHV